MPELTVVKPASLPTPLNGHLYGLLRRTYNAVQVEFETALIDVQRAPTPAERQALQARSAEISQWFAPAGQQAVVAEVASVFSTLLPRTGSTDDMEVQYRIYAADLCDLPLFAVAGACKAYRMGRVGNRRNAPTQAEIRYEAEKLIEPLAEEKSKIDLVLTAKPVGHNEVRKGKITDLVRSTLTELRQTSERQQAKRPGMSPGELERARRVAAQIEAGQEVTAPAPTSFEDDLRAIYGTQLIHVATYPTIPAHGQISGLSARSGGGGEPQEQR